MKNTLKFFSLLFIAYFMSNFVIGAQKKILEFLAFVIRNTYAFFFFLYFSSWRKKTVLRIYGFLLKDMGSEMFPIAIASHYLVFHAASARSVDVVQRYENYAMKIAIIIYNLYLTCVNSKRMEVRSE